MISNRVLKTYTVNVLLGFTLWWFMEIYEYTDEQFLTSSKYACIQWTNENVGEDQ